MSMFGGRKSFGAFDTEAEELRGMSNSRLLMLNNEQITLLALSVLMDAMGVDDDSLIELLGKRAGVVGGRKR